jgi:surface carbohydrate biosynthesis protein
MNLPKYFNIEKKLLPLVLKYCEKFNLKLNILGRGSQQELYESEYEFYKKIIKLKKNNFLKRKIFPKNYKEIDKFDIVVFADSTLGYEAIARGNKVAIFSARKNAPKGKISNFGWPKKLIIKVFFILIQLIKKKYLEF